MAFDLQEVFANLAEKEKIKGHHSPEGAAIRILSRALTGWLAGNLRVLDVLVLCEQGMEDWLKRRLALRSWSSLGLSELLSRAIDKELVTRLDAVRLQKLHLTRVRLDDEGGGNPRDVESALELCLRIVEKHW
jgi:ferredoxin-fold anticodon binding domain-containing protein